MRSCPRIPARFTHPPTSLILISCYRPFFAGRNCHALLLPQMGKQHRIATDFGRNASQYPKGGRSAGTFLREAMQLRDFCPAAGSIVAVRALHALVSLLCFDAEGGDRPGFEAADADRFIRFFAKTVGPVV
jgi:hypothetical protein